MQCSQQAGRVRAGAVGSWGILWHMTAIYVQRAMHSACLFVPADQSSEPSISVQGLVIIINQNSLIICPFIPPAHEAPDEKEQVLPAFRGFQPFLTISKPLVCRCHPTLSGIPNRLFYEGRLKDGCSAQNRAGLVRGIPELVCLHVPGTCLTDTSTQVITSQSAIIYRDTGAGFSLFVNWSVC